MVRQSWVRHCSLLELSDIVLYLVRIQLMHRLLLKWFSKFTVMLDKEEKGFVCLSDAVVNC